jgi:DNA primase
MTSPIDEIKAKIDIVDLISEYVQLRPAGKNFKALCPFHQEKVPSFYVSPERQIWHCFGQCNDGGDIFKFIMKMENVEFPEALRILAKRAGVELKTDDYHLTSQRTRLLDILQVAAKFYHKILLESSLAAKARAYLKKRQLQDKTIKEFQLGFAPDRRDELLKFLTKRGFKEQEIELAGLIIKTTQSPSGQVFGLLYYDRFRNRIVFPLTDVYGNIVGFTGRIMPTMSAVGPEAENKEVPKYVNTPETPVYNKSRLLYGLDKAKEAIKKEGFAILVEGNMDVITAHQSGTKNVVASSGTSLTIEQVKLLKRYTNNLILAFDVDLAGQAATQRGIDIALAQEMNIKILHLPQGKDPDECIRENPKDWFLAIRKAQPIMEYYFQLAFQGRDKDNLEDKKAITNLLLPQLAKFGNLIERDHWLKILSEKLDVAETVLRESLAKIKFYPLKNEKEDVSSSKPPVEQMTAERLLALILRFPQLCIQYFTDLPLGVFEGQSRVIAKNILDCYESEKMVDLQKIQEKISDSNLISYLDYLLLLAEKEFSKIEKKEVEKEAGYLSRRLKYWWLSKKMAEMVKNLKIAENNRERDKIKELTEEIKKITQALAELNNNYTK